MAWSAEAYLPLDGDNVIDMLGGLCQTIQIGLQTGTLA
jgi:hypothetical protein